MAPMNADVVAATATENLASFGLLAPSPFDTLTLNHM
jgi:hypothetical protein